ncbi:MAG: hypothetical protein KDC61_22820, partial [Saprospiraceae bacterium]|nr:hypothetical protein [Saprospiraceae bacterium]
MVALRCWSQPATEGILFSRNLRFEQLTDDDGLSNAFVTCMYQDEKGFLWLGTANGLNRFDGYQFKSWIPEKNNPQSLSHNEVWSLCGSSDGTIWVGTANGLNRFDPKRERFTRYYNDPSNQYSLSHNFVHAIYEDSDGNIWIGTGNGLSLLKKDSSRFIRYRYSPGKEGNSVRCIVGDETGLIWFGFMDTLFSLQPYSKII